ncbi:hypothetical protein E3N88_32982 [Mikania micrantha]|uniref:Uncharacterized protein n=1 Tax=Mikania micrantha TaxID=192012 RepID=A0A5N6MAI8_9ASTR|nr:hypothetical protein E3N88_32982 [Mikania micrantha]
MLSLFPFRYQNSFGPLTGKGDGPQVLGQGEPKSVNTPTLMERGLPVCSNKIHSVPFIKSGSIPIEGSAIDSVEFPYKPLFLISLVACMFVKHSMVESLTLVLDPAQYLSGNKVSADLDEKLSRSNSGIKEKDQVCTEDIAGWEYDEIVKDQKDDNYHPKKYETRSEPGMFTVDVHGHIDNGLGCNNTGPVEDDENSTVCTRKVAAQVETQTTQAHWEAAHMAVQETSWNQIHQEQMDLLKIS